MNAQTEQPQMAEATMLIVQLAEKLGVMSIKDLPGAWYHRIDKTWAVAANAHKEPKHCGPEDGMDIDLPPYHFAVWKNGWLLAMLTPCAGTFMGADHAAEDEFCNMMQSLIQQ